MATYQIDGVRTAEAPRGYHEHITAVRLAASGGLISRETVISDLRSPYGDRYYTFAAGTRADGSLPAALIADTATTSRPRRIGRRRTTCSASRGSER